MFEKKEFLYYKGFSDLSHQHSPPTSPLRIYINAHLSFIKTNID